MIPYKTEREYLEPPASRDTRIICRCCMEAVQDGDTYYEIGGLAYCEHCVRDSRKIAEDTSPWN